METGYEPNPDEPDEDTTEGIDDGEKERQEDRDAERKQEGQAASEGQEREVSP